MGMKVPGKSPAPRTTGRSEPQFLEKPEELGITATLRPIGADDGRLHAQRSRWIIMDTATRTETGSKRWSDGNL